MTTQTDTVVNRKGKTPWYVYIYRISYLYRSCRLAVRRIVSSGMGLPHQRASGVFLCLGSLEKRETRLEVKSNHMLKRARPLRDGGNPRPHGAGR